MATAHAARRHVEHCAFCPDPLRGALVNLHVNGKPRQAHMACFERWDVEDEIQTMYAAHIASTLGLPGEEP